MCPSEFHGLSASAFPVLSSDGFAYICSVPAELMYLDPKRGVFKVCPISMHRGWDFWKMNTFLLFPSKSPAGEPMRSGVRCAWSRQGELKQAVYFWWSHTSGYGVGQVGSGHIGSMCPQPALSSGKVSPELPDTLVFPINRNLNDYKNSAL